MGGPIYVDSVCIPLALALLALWMAIATLVGGEMQE